MIERYFSSLDRKDWVALGACFTQEARAEYNSGEKQLLLGRRAIVKRIEQLARPRISNHVLSNVSISVTGSTATAWAVAGGRASIVLVVSFLRMTDTYDEKVRVSADDLERFATDCDGQLHAGRR